MVLVFVAALLGYYALLFLAQRWLLYPAPRGPLASALPPHVEQINPDSTAVAFRAFFLPAHEMHGPGPAIIFFHGNAERAEHSLADFEPARAAGVAILLVEYPGYGEAPGSPTQASLTDAALAGYDWLAQRPGIDSARIIAWGRSLGGGVATRLATRRKVAALIMESSFTSVRAFAWRYLAPGFLVRDPFDNLAELKDYRGPLLVLHGEQDDIAPFAHGQALAAAHPGSQMVVLPCGHNDCERPWAPALVFLWSLRLAAPLRS